ncbi:MAG: phage holin family protein [Burkholderiaceae bacterium]|nr:phage holin family protein [Burkholderiaceae bacterium]
MEQAPPDGPAESNKAKSGLMDGVFGVARNALGLALNRLELAALELSEARAAALSLALVFALGLVATWFALAYWSALLVYLAWPSWGWKILFVIAAGFTLLALALLWYARGIVAQGKLSLPATMNELRNDRDALL